MTCSVVNSNRAGWASASKNRSIIDAAVSATLSGPWMGSAFSESANPKT